MRGVIASEPGRSLGVFTLGPRVFIDHADLPSTGLLTFGSDVDYEMLLKVPDAALGPLTDDLEAAFANEYVSIRSYRRRQDWMAENLIRTENYLSLVGLIVLILGGIGVSSVTRVFVQQKIRSIAILKCVGWTSPPDPGGLSDTSGAARVAGSALGVALAGAILAAFPLLLSGAARCCFRWTSVSPRERSHKAWPSGCSCRSCFRWCPCSRCVKSSRRCSCGRTSHRFAASTG